jgi:hypothetical protein
MRALLAISILTLAIGAWGGFWFLTYTLYGDRTEYATALAESQENSTRGEAAVRLRTLIRESEAERAMLEDVFNITILEAVETIEATGRSAGARSVTIGSATPLPASPTQKGLTNVSIVVNAEGSFGALMRAVSLFEVMPVPSVVEHFEITKRDASWDLTARLRTTIATPIQ